MAQSRFGGVTAPVEVAKAVYYDPAYEQAPRRRGTLATGAGLGGVAAGAGMLNSSARLTEASARAKTRAALASAREARKKTATAATEMGRAKSKRAQRSTQAAYRSALVDSSSKTNYAAASVRSLKGRKARRVKLAGGGLAAVAGGAGLLALGARQRREY